MRPSIASKNPRNSWNHDIPGQSTHGPAVGILILVAQGRRSSAQTQTDGLRILRGRVAASHPAIQPSMLGWCRQRRLTLATRRERLRLTLVGSQRLNWAHRTAPYRNRRRLNKVGACVWLPGLLLFGSRGWEGTLCWITP